MLNRLLGIFPLSRDPRAPLPLAYRFRRKFKCCKGSSPPARLRRSDLRKQDFSLACIAPLCRPLSCTCSRARNVDLAHQPLTFSPNARKYVPISCLTVLQYRKPFARHESRGRSPELDDLQANLSSNSSRLKLVVLYECSSESKRW